MKHHPLAWLIGQVRNRLWAVVLMIVAQVANALLGVYFALGSRGVIDSAVAGDRQAFYRACMIQAYFLPGPAAPSAGTAAGLAGTGLETEIAAGLITW